MIWKANHGQLLQSLETVRGSGRFRWGPHWTWTSYTAKHMHRWSRSLQRRRGDKIIHPLPLHTDWHAAVWLKLFTSYFRCTCREVHWLGNSLNLGFDWPLREEGESFSPERRFKRKKIFYPNVLCLKIFFICELRFYFNTRYITT